MVAIIAEAPPYGHNPEARPVSRRTATECDLIRGIAGLDEASRLVRLTRRGDGHGWRAAAGDRPTMRAISSNDTRFFGSHEEYDRTALRPGDESPADR